MGIIIAATNCNFFDHLKKKKPIKKPGIIINDSPI